MLPSTDASFEQNALLVVGVLMLCSPSILLKPVVMCTVFIIITLIANSQSKARVNPCSSSSYLYELRSVAVVTSYS